MHTIWYEVNGVSKDAETILAHRDEWQNWLISMLRDYGYVPNLDLTSEWSMSYIEASEKFSWQAKIPVCHVGKDVSWECRGVFRGNLIPVTNPTPLSKSGRSSTQSE